MRCNPVSPLLSGATRRMSAPSRFRASPGHAVRVAECWVAYDATHFNPAENGFRIIGTFATVEEAKEAILGSVSLRWLRASGDTNVDSGTRLNLRPM